MKTRNLLVLTSLLAALAVALPPAAMAKRCGTDRPVRGRGSATDTVNLATGAGTGAGTARISHLGRTMYHHSFTITPTGGSGVAIAGTDTFTAANGDLLSATFTGNGTLTGLGVGETAHVTGVLAITGGTGRFAHSHGTLAGTFDAKTISLVGTTLVNRDRFTLRGRIRY
jgi:hypothetical protein